MTKNKMFELWGKAELLLHAFEMQYFTAVKVNEIRNSNYNSELSKLMAQMDLLKNNIKKLTKVMYNISSEKEIQKIHGELVDFKDEMNDFFKNMKK